VPPTRILARYPRTLAHLTRAVRTADAAVLHDSQDVTPGMHTAVALCKKDWTQELVQPLPAWAQRVLWGRE
jgi:predicted ABC-type ATPase